MWRRLIVCCTSYLLLSRLSQRSLQAIAATAAVDSSTKSTASAFALSGVDVPLKPYSCAQHQSSTIEQRRTFVLSSGGESKAMASKEPNSAENCSGGEISVAFVTTPDETSAKKLAHGLVEQQLAACVNIIPRIHSVYLWEGKVNEDQEYLMMIKTRTNRLDDLIKWVRENHSYSVAEVISVPIEKGNGPYLQWILDTVPSSSKK